MWRLTADALFRRPSCQLIHLRTFLSSDEGAVRRLYVGAGERRPTRPSVSADGVT